MIPIPKHIIKEIDKILWNFLWDGIQPLVNKQTMCLDVENGGITIMITLNSFIEAKHIKFIHKIVNAEMQHWNMIGKHRLKHFDRTYDSNNFLYNLYKHKRTNHQSPIPVLQRRSTIMGFI